MISASDKKYLPKQVFFVSHMIFLKNNSLHFTDIRGVRFQELDCKYDQTFKWKLIKLF